MQNLIRIMLASLLVVCGLSQVCNGYSVLTHEEIVDLLWADSIKPMLLHKYPGATDEDLRKAHAYAYGGCLIQDMGYYPFGNKLFSDLVHYVRSGDFVEALWTKPRILTSMPLPWEHWRIMPPISLAIQR